MRIGRGLILLATGIPGIFIAACSASNGDPIPSEVRDAEALEVGSNEPPDRDRDGASPPQDGGVTKDATTKDAPADAPPDAPSSATVRINEIYVDRVGGGDKTEFVEVRGAEGTPVDDLFVRLVDHNGVVHEFDLGTAGQKIGATGTWVIGSPFVSGRIDRSVTVAQGWGLDDRGAVQLVRGASKELVDVVGWTNDPDGGVVPQPSTNPKATGEGKPFVVPPGVSSFGRRATGADTDDNRADFCSMTISNGATNGACL